MPAPDAFAADLALLGAAAIEAGAIARRHFKQGAKVWDKGDGQGPVTEADFDVNDHLRDALVGARPGYGWLSEESDPLGDLTRLGADPVFVVDPIDGTRAFIDGQPGFAHALAVVHRGQPVAAVVYLPMMDLTYAAVRGGRGHAERRADCRAPAPIAMVPRVSGGASDVRSGALAGRHAGAGAPLSPLAGLAAGADRRGAL